MQSIDATAPARHAAGSILLAKTRGAGFGLLCGGVLAGGAQAQLPGAGPAEVPSVVVSGIRSEQSTVTVPASISTITREEIEASGAQQLVDVLRGQGAVQVFDAFGDGSRAQVGMRGFGETANANTLVLVDGRRLNNSDIGPPDLNTIALQDIERIEIIQGSAGTLFGDQAVGGVINIITRTPRRFTASAEAGFGDHARRVVRARLADQVTDQLAYRVSVEEIQSNNFRDHNEKRQSNYFGRVDLTHSRGSLFAELQRSDEVLELPGGLTRAQLEQDRRQAAPFFLNDELETQTRVARTGLDQQLYGPWTLEVELSHREEDTRGTFFASDFATDRRQNEVTPRLIGIYPFEHGDLTLTLGSDVRIADFELRSPAVGATDNRQDVQAVYGQAVIPVLPGLSLTAGARKAWVENDLTTTNPFGLPAFPNGVEIDDDVFVAEVGVSYRPTPEWRLFARRDGNFRFAKADEQSFTVPGQTGLDTQEGVSYEFGAEWQRGGHRFKLVGFRLDLDDEIVFDPTVTGPSPFIAGANVNLDSTVRYGLVAEGGWQAHERLRLSADVTFTQAEFDSGGLDGNDVPFVSDVVSRVAADAQLTDYLHAQAEVQTVSDRFLIGDNLNAFPQVDGYTVLNLAVDYRYRGWEVKARVNNVTGKEFVDFASPFSFFPAPERNFWLTVGYKYD